MDFSFTRDDRSQRLVCIFRDAGLSGIVTAADAAAAGADLLMALDDVRDTGFGECFWPEAGGEFRWMLRRTGQRLTVVALWSSGTLTGWQHVLRAETDVETFSAHVRQRLSYFNSSSRRD